MSKEITLVFTDIQDSTAHWEKFQDDFKSVLDQHNQIMRKNISDYHGTEIKTEGDAFMIAFNRAVDALFFCLNCQAEIKKFSWPRNLGQLKVRMGFHTGNPISVASDSQSHLDYLGPMVNRSARISGSAHGGQILLTQSSFERLPDDLEEIGFKNFGRFYLKSLESPETLYQAYFLKEENQENFPCPTAEIEKKGFLPEAKNKFYGRKVEQVDIIQELNSPNQILTIVGPGGTGKTSLALKIAEDQKAYYPGGVWLIDL